MSKKRKTPATSTKSARKTEAPMRVTRTSDDKVAAPVPAPTAPVPAPAAPAPVAKAVTVTVPPLASTTVAAKPAVAAQPTAPTEIVLDRAQVARLAFAKFAARGYAHGHHVEDWFAAEAELRAAHN